MNKPQTKSTEAAKPVRVRRTHLQRREESSRRLFDAAFQLIAKGGLETLSLASVSELAGCSRELPRYLYGSRDEFVDALIDDTKQLWSDNIGLHPNDDVIEADAVLAIFDSLHRLFLERKDTRGRLLLVLGLAGSANARQRKKAKAVPDAIRQQMLNILETQIAAGKISSRVDAAALATLLDCTGVGIGYRWLSNPRSFDIDATLDQMRGIIQAYLSSRN